MRKLKVVVSRNGRAVTLTGWRAWLAFLAALLVAWLLLAIFAFVLIGFAVTAGLALLLLVPAVIVALAFHAAAMRS